MANHCPPFSRQELSVADHVLASLPNRSIVLPNKIGGGWPTRARTCAILSLAANGGNDWLALVDDFRTLPLEQIAQDIPELGV